MSTTVKCDYCTEYRALLLPLLNGHKMYLCALCGNEMDEFVRDKLGKLVFHEWAENKHVMRYGNLHEDRLRELLKEIDKQQETIFNVQREWIIENVNENVRDRIVEALVKDEVELLDES